MMRAVHENPTIADFLFCSCELFLWYFGLSPWPFFLYNGRPTAIQSMDCMKAQQRQCLNCGMAVAIAPLHFDDIPPRQICIKCDNDIYQQSNGSCLTQDIAHQHETIVKALQKLDAVLVSAWTGYYKEFRVIVGGGQIRQQVLGQLHYYQQQRKILSCQEESPNHGALIAVLRKT